MEEGYRQEVSERCTEDCNNRQWLDVYTPEIFDNLYYRGLIDNKGVMASDQALWSDPAHGSQFLVKSFAESIENFFEAWAYCFLQLSMLGTR
eukprot:TRINITY_DN3463_c0_g1_i1.p1 TRINITY_DN3463_c0_g1~~TRINITY_DN3463_c0_g1_i1.p1  ORF type:complete len:100 (-),score=19.00 TRINITY_DN3463_c0_g1_i1:282-557(-)